MIAPSTKPNCRVAPSKDGSGLYLACAHGTTAFVARGRALQLTPTTAPFCCHTLRQIVTSTGMGGTA